MKTNNMSEALKLMLLGVAAIVTCIVVILIFQAVDIARDINEGATSKMASINLEIQGSEFNRYDDNEVYGSDVVSCIKQYLGDYNASETAPIYVLVTTSSVTNAYTNGANITSIKDFTNVMYVKPTAVFLGDVIKNKNDVIVGIQFIQQ